MRKALFAAAICAAFATPAMAVSVGEIIRLCGDDSKAYCKGVGYGDPMQACLASNYKKLSAQCKVVVDRIRGGEKVSLF